MTNLLQTPTASRPSDLPSFSRLRARRILVVVVLALGLVLLGPSVAGARDSSARKLGRGVSNIGLGVLAIPGQIVRTTRDRGPFIGATWGFAKGGQRTRRRLRTADLFFRGAAEFQADHEARVPLAVFQRDRQAYTLGGAPARSTSRSPGHLRDGRYPNCLANGMNRSCNRLTSPGVISSSKSSRPNTSRIDPDACSTPISRVCGARRGIGR